MPVVFFNGKFQEGDIENIPREIQVPIYLEKPQIFATVDKLPDTQYYTSGNIIFDTKSNQFYVLSVVVDSMHQYFKFWSEIPYVNHF